jgi:hypothetical protein
MKNANRWNRSLREVGWFLGIFPRCLHLWHPESAEKKKRKDAILLQKKTKKTKNKTKNTKKTPKKETVQFETGKKEKIRFSWRKKTP